jgi:hypothetical protein
LEVVAINDGCIATILAATSAEARFGATSDAPANESRRARSPRRLVVLMTIVQCMLKVDDIDTLRMENNGGYGDIGTRRLR